MACGSDIPEQIRDVIELSYLHVDLFREHQSAGRRAAHARPPPVKR